MKTGRAGSDAGQEPTAEPERGCPRLVSDSGFQVCGGSTLLLSEPLVHSSLLRQLWTWIPHGHQSPPLGHQPASK